MMNSEIVKELREGWLQVKVPLPFSLKWVNSYLVAESGGYTVIDPGLGTGEAKTLWENVLQQCGLVWGDIKRVIVTHQHPDHYGLAGYMQQKSGCPVFISRRSHAYARRLWSEGSSFPADLRKLYSEHGMPCFLMDAIENNLLSFLERVTPQPEVSYLEAGERVSLGGMWWETIDAPGHAYGALCFYERDSGWMICGDQVLPDITPNVSVVPGEEIDPLEAFLNSLEELKKYEVSLALPGHRNPFAHFRRRIEELQGHHARRLAGIVEMLLAEPKTGFALCEELFSSRLRDNPHNLRFAMSETLAHLNYLEQRGRIRSLHANNVIVYQAM